MTKDDVLFGYRQALFAEATRTSVAEACRRFGVHRSTFYAWKRAVDGWASSAGAARAVAASPFYIWRRYRAWGLRSALPSIVPTGVTYPIALGVFG
jgi:Transposase